MTVCTKCGGAGLLYVGAAARFAVRCDCAVEQRRRSNLTVGGFPAEYADLTAADALTKSARDPALADRYRRIAERFASPDPGDALRFVTVGFFGVSPDPLAGYFAAAHALVRPVKAVLMSQFIDARFAKRPPPAVDADAAVFVVLGREPRHSYLPSETENFLRGRLLKGSFVVVVCAADPYEIERLYGRAVVGLTTAEGRPVL